MKKLRVLDLFSGIGGFSLGLERTGGFETVAFCEIEPFCRRVLKKHWPDVPIYEDVRTLTADRLAADGISVDVICGGFPCQDISLAGNGAGIEGERSGLWADYARIIGDLRPQFIIVENVAALLGRGLDRVLGDLAAFGFDAEWHCIPASAVGAPHRRDRIWIVAHPKRQQQRQDAVSDGRRAVVAREAAGERSEGAGEIAGCSSILADANSEGHGHQHRSGQNTDQASSNKSEGNKRKRVRDVSRRSSSDVSYSDTLNAQRKFSRRNDSIFRREQIERQARLCSGAGEHQDWSVEPSVGRVAHGVPDRVGQLRAYGNAVVPQIPEMIGHAILQARAAA